MKTALYILAGILVLALVLVQLGVLGGSRPADLGVSKGRLKPPSPTPNSVSSQAGLYPDHPLLGARRRRRPDHGRRRVDRPPPPMDAVDRR